MVDIRPARPEEADAIEQLHRRAALVWERDRASLLAHPDAIGSPAGLIAQGRVRVAVEDGRLIGFAAVVPGGPGAVELDGLFVEPDRMGQGVGRLLVADAAARATADGATVVEVTANTEAAGFYERVGFVRSGSVATRFGPAVRLALALGGGARGTVDTVS